MDTFHPARRSLARLPGLAILAALGACATAPVIEKRQVWNDGTTVLTVNAMSGPLGYDELVDSSGTVRVGRDRKYNQILDFVPPGVAVVYHKDEGAADGMVGLIDLQGRELIKPDNWGGLFNLDAAAACGAVILEDGSYQDRRFGVFDLTGKRVTEQAYLAFQGPKLTSQRGFLVAPSAAKAAERYVVLACDGRETGGRRFEKLLRVFDDGDAFLSSADGGLYRATTGGKTVLEAAAGRWDRDTVFPEDKLKIPEVVLFDDGLGRPLRILRRSDGKSMTLKSNGYDYEFTGAFKVNLLAGPASVSIHPSGWSEPVDRIEGRVFESYDRPKGLLSWKGEGILFRNGRKVYEGEFANNSFGPQGTYYFEDGGKYTGRFSGPISLPPRISGSGTYTDPQGKAEARTFAEDTRVAAAWEGVPAAGRTLSLDSWEFDGLKAESEAEHPCRLLEPEGRVSYRYEGGCKDGLAEGPGRAYFRISWNSAFPDSHYFFAGSFLRGRPRGRGKLVDVTDPNGVVKLCDFESLRFPPSPIGLNCVVAKFDLAAKKAGRRIYEGGLFEGSYWRQGKRAVATDDYFTGIGEKPPVPGVQAAYYAPLAGVSGEVLRGGMEFIPAQADSVEGFTAALEPSGDKTKKYKDPDGKAMKLSAQARDAFMINHTMEAQNLAGEALRLAPDNPDVKAVHDAIEEELRRREYETAMSAGRREAERQQNAFSEAVNRIGTTAQSLAQKEVRDSQAKRSGATPGSNTVSEGARRRDERLDAYRNR